MCTIYTLYSEYTAARGTSFPSSLSSLSTSSFPSSLSSPSCPSFPSSLSSPSFPSSPSTPSTLASRPLDYGEESCKRNRLSLKSDEGKEWSRHLIVNLEIEPNNFSLEDRADFFVCLNF